MENIIKDFKKYIEKNIAINTLYVKINKISKETIERKEAIPFYATLQIWFDFSDEELANNGAVYLQFKELSHILEISSFNSSEIAQIVLECLKRNIKAKILEDIPLIKLSDLNNYNFKYTTSKEVKEMFTNGTISNFLNTSDDDLDEASINRKREITDFAKNSITNNQTAVLAHKAVKEHYFDVESINESDIKIILNSLKSLGLSDYIIRCINDFLLKKSKNDIPNILVKFRENLDEFLAKKEKELSMLTETKSISNASYFLARLNTYTTFLQFDRVFSGHNEIISNFENICYFLNNSDFTDNEKALVILELVNHFIKKGITKVTNFKACESLNASIFVNTKDGDIETMLSSTNFINARENSDIIFPVFNCEGIDMMSYLSFLTRDAILSKNNDTAIHDLSGSDIESFEEVINQYKKVEKHYTNKEDVYDENDIAVTLDALATLNIDKNMLKIIRHFLYTNLQKRKKGYNTTESVEYIPKKALESRPLLKKGMYNKIYRLLGEYFNTDRMEPFCYLPLDEIVYVVCLMKELNFETRVIKVFILKSIKSNATYSRDPMKLYIEIREKLEYYSNLGIEEIRNILNEVDTAFEEMLICDDKTYVTNKECIGLFLSDACKLIEDFADYEMKISGRILKDNNGEMPLVNRRL